MNDAVKYCKSFYTIGGDHNDRTGDNKVFETNEPIMKLVAELMTKSKKENVDPAMHNSTRTAQTYFAHKLIHVKKARFCFENERVYF
jgi:hypothetical protein